MIRLTKEQIMLLHRQLIQETGGCDGLRDDGLLEFGCGCQYKRI